MSKITAFLKDESGAAAAEYVLILAILGAGIAGGMTVFGGKIVAALTRSGTLLDAVN